MSDTIGFDSSDLRTILPDAESAEIARFACLDLQPLSSNMRVGFNSCLNGGIGIFNRHNSQLS
jgi:hypothetical protein